MFTVYTIYNKNHDKIYIGQTSNLIERLKLHNERKFTKSYTASFDGRWILIHKEEFNSRVEALKREKQLKSFRGRRFIHNLIKINNPE